MDFPRDLATALLVVGALLAMMLVVVFVAGLRVLWQAVAEAEASVGRLRRDVEPERQRPDRRAHAGRRRRRCF